MKHPRSQSRRCEPRLPLPFPLQDSEGRLACISQLYEHAADATCHPPQCGRLSDHASPSGYAAAKGHMPWKSGHLHDSEVPPDCQCSRSIEPPPNNSTGHGTFAACPKELCTRHHVRRHQRCEGHGPCHDPLSSCLATLARYGHGR